MNVSELLSEVDASNTKDLDKFEKWYGKNDLWHPDFPKKFDACMSKYIKTDAYLIAVGKSVADNAHSFYRKDMESFIAYANKNPIPAYEGDDDGDGYEEEQEKFYDAYVIKALKKM